MNFDFKSVGIKNSPFPSKKDLRFLIPNLVMIFFSHLAQTLSSSSLIHFQISSLEKYGASKKQMKPIGSFSTINNFEPSIGASNYIAIVQDYDHYDQTINLIIQYMPKHPLFNAFNSVEYLVPLSVI